MTLPSVTNRKTSGSEKVLLAAYALESGGSAPYPVECLVVEAWRRYPRTFGLKGFEDRFPDSNRVTCLIMGTRGLVSRGWLTRTPQRLYCLTAAAGEWAKGMETQEGE